ncbi:single-stranded DNA-binding protein [Pseudoxanthomonas beigongshangi]
MSIVRVKSENIIERRVVIDGQSKIFREQRACILLEGGYETAFNIGLDDGPVYSVGDYLFDGDSYGQNQYGELMFKRRKKLRPLAAWLKECAVVLPAAGK